MAEKQLIGYVTALAVLNAVVIARMYVTLGKKHECRVVTTIPEKFYSLFHPEIFATLVVFFPLCLLVLGPLDDRSHNK